VRGSARPGRGHRLGLPGTQELRRHQHGMQAPLFETVEEAVILEDDCLPHPTFFRFCQQLLARYREDERVMAISGDNFQFGRKRTEHSYYFSRYPHCWGWATWRRAWKHYDGEMYLWPTIKQNHWLHDILEDQRAVSYWTSILDDTYAGKINTWNYAWTFSCWTQSGLTILPNVNLVSNIGFGPQATHTRGTSQQAEMEVRPMAFPLLHPPCMIRDSEADHRTQRALQEQSRLTARIRRKALTTLRAVREALRM